MCPEKLYELSIVLNYPGDELTVLDCKWVPLNISGAAHIKGWETKSKRNNHRCKHRCSVSFVSVVGLDSLITS